LNDTSSVNSSGFVGRLTERVKDESLLNQMLYVDTKTWLPNDLLIKANKITMANSLELRVPLLDHKVLEFAASLPAEYKVEGKHTKRVLKAAFAKELPQQVLRRKKAGFPVPYASWLRGVLKDAIYDILLSDRAVCRGYFKRNEIACFLSRLCSF
jgi:asparagine synthase (glutamine-hydrolysing)